MRVGVDKAWDGRLYDSKHSFVWKAARDLVTLLDPKPGERILDLGCGTGHLTQQIASSGATVLGIDVSEAMLDEARRSYPALIFEKADAAAFETPAPFDAVFSNAALHWIRPPEAVARRVHAALRPGGRFVAELGGEGNVRTVHGALEQAIREAGHEPLDESALLYFPSLGSYASVLEAAGFRVTHAFHFDRPTRLPEGDGELRNWIRGFADRFLAVVPEPEREGVLGTVEERVRGRLSHDGAWHIDYVRLRVRAEKPR
jgi:trans-aconitate methyltransferase